MDDKKMLKVRKAVVYASFILAVINTIVQFFMDEVALNTILCLGIMLLIIVIMYIDETLGRKKDKSLYIGYVLWFVVVIKYLFIQFIQI